MSQLQYFLGANSPGGFYSLYDELSDPARIETLYILKGGPGCGKSSLMKRVAKHAEALGVDTQLILCSGDPDSVDGVYMPQKGVAIVDGTAPHVVEARCPGAVEVYVDLSRFYDRAGLQACRDGLLEVTAEYKGCYRRAYRSLAAAGELGRSLTEQSGGGELRQRLEKRAAGIIARELRSDSGGSGRLDRRFLSALTHRGTICLWDTVTAQAGRVYELADNFGSARHILSPLLSAALAAGHDAVLCPDPMAPDLPLHLILPGLSLAFVTSTAEAPWPHRPYRRLRLDAMLPADSLREQRPRMRFSRKVADALKEDGVAALAEAKAAHDRLEGLYNPHVDFPGVYAAADRLAAEILH